MKSSESLLVVVLAFSVFPLMLSCLGLSYAFSHILAICRDIVLEDGITKQPDDSEDKINHAVTFSAKLGFTSILVAVVTFCTITPFSYYTEVTTSYGHHTATISPPIAVICGLCLAIGMCICVMPPLWTSYKTYQQLHYVLPGWLKLRKHN